jgi:hypothetical protein
MALTPIQQIRLVTQDNDPAFPFVTDAEIEYFLSVNENNINRTAIAVCKVILLQLSLRGNETIDIFSIQGSKSASEFRASLELFLRDPSLNPALTSATGYAGGVSLSDIAANYTADTNYICTPLSDTSSYTTLDI